ncbi:MAG TPA: flavodoxin domain-containing protein [Nitrososphaerales archaeon]|nr:flavodoxin domain-containing protein [Nitrososphaerales archaeon]
MRAIVVFDSRYGNTEKIARSLAAGISEAGVETACLNSRDAKVGALKECDLVCIGAPTEAFSASKPIKEFLAKLDGADLADKRGFAFDTKLGSRVSGSASKFIEKRLKTLGLSILAPRESAIVLSPASRDRASATRLKEGEEQRFLQVGKMVGDSLLASARPVPA